MPLSFRKTGQKPWAGLHPVLQRASTPASVQLPETKEAGRGRPAQGVPSMGRISLDERSQSEPMTATVAEPQGVAARRSRKKRKANPRPEEFRRQAFCQTRLTPPTRVACGRASAPGIRRA